MRWTMPGVLLLAACSGGEDKAADPPPAKESAADRTAEAVAPLPKANEPGPVQNDPAIPVAIQGRWAVDAADCSKQPGTDLSVLTIDAANLRFHESHGELVRVRETGSRRLVADYKFSGEGMEWDRRMRLEAVGDGKTLVQHDVDEGADARPMRYTRCA